MVFCERGTWFFFYASIFSDKANTVKNGVSDIEIHNKWSNKSRPEAFNHRFEKFWDFFYLHTMCLVLQIDK